MLERECRRGGVWLANLDPVVGAEIGKKIRPVVIIQNDIGNKYSPIVIVAAITSAFRKHYPQQVRVNAPEGGLPKDSIIMMNQIRSVDKQRLVKYLGSLSRKTMDKVDIALKISLQLTPI